LESGWSGGTARSSIQKISIRVQSTASEASVGKNADATDPPGRAMMNFSRLAITSAACV
jgi:hypothetical protein